MRMGESAILPGSPICPTPDTIIAQSKHLEGIMRELIAKTRTYRRFDQKSEIEQTILDELLDCARLGGSARNCQPWQYMVVTDRQSCDAIFPYLAWAGYLADWKGPVEGERPTAYVLCLLNRAWLKGNDKEAHFDLGIASQNLLLAAMNHGIGGCRIGAFSPKLADLFEIPEQLDLELVIALGYPKETVIIEKVPDDGDIKYWHDAQQCHHVPKRALKDILITLERRG